MPELHSMHDALGRVTKGNPNGLGQSPALSDSQLGRRATSTSWPSKERVVSVFWRAIRELCHLTRSLERIVSQGSR